MVKGKEIYIGSGITIHQFRRMAIPLGGQGIAIPFWPKIIPTNQTLPKCVHGK